MIGIMFGMYYTTYNLSNLKDSSLSAGSYSEKGDYSTSSNGDWSFWMDVGMHYDCNEKTCSLEQKRVRERSTTDLIGEVSVSMEEERRVIEIDAP